MRIGYRLLLLVSYCLFCLQSFGSNKDSILIFSTEIPSFDDEYLIQHLNYKCQKKSVYNVNIQCFQVGVTDTTVLYNVNFNKIKFKQGAHRLALNLDKNSSATFIDYSFLRVIRLFNQIPPGKYYTVVYIHQDTIQVGVESSIITVDSTLPVYSDVRKSLNKFNVSRGKPSVRKVATPRAIQDAKLLNRQAAILSDKAKKMNGVNSIVVNREGRVYNAFYYSKWFLGYYEAQSAAEMSSRSSEEMKLLKEQPADLIKTDLPSFRSISSQFRQLNKANSKEKKDDDIEGNISVTGNFSNAQEPRSNVENNFQEYKADFHASILNMPVVVEGYYTTQDNNRKAKASFVRVRYDFDKQKKELDKTVGNYRQMYDNTGAQSSRLIEETKGKLNTLKQQQALNLKQASNVYALDSAALLSSNSYSDKIGNVKDTGAASRIRKNKQDVEKRYKQIRETQQKIEQLEKLLSQYEKAQYFDSVLDYSKITKVTNREDYSYKSLLRAAQNIMPASKTKSFLAGLTKLDIGILNNYESSYTANGQTLKGINAGYDFDAFKATVSVGKTEYISRSGDVDRYNTYLFKIDAKPVLKQKIGAIYYLCSPGKQMLDDKQFAKNDKAVTGYMQPTHIVSLMHSGVLMKGLNMENEAAYSYKNGGSIKTSDWEHTAVKSELEYVVTKANANLKLGWEHTGKNFENNALPYVMAGTDKYIAAIDKMFFGSFLKMGVQYNRLQQNAFSSTGYNVKWGFDMQTYSKRYPSLLVSYKPFSSFRRWDDTMTIVQRPVLGAVWTVRGSYQIKRKGLSHRFMFTYNNNSSTADTISYTAQILQAAYIYMSGKNLANINMGWSSQPQYTTDGTSAINNTMFAGISASRQFGKAMLLAVGTDMALAPWGIMKWGSSLAINYRLNKFPLSIHAQGRYSSIRLNEYMAAKDIWSGQLGIEYRFRTQTPQFKRK